MVETVADNPNGGGNFANAKDKEYEIFSDCIQREWIIIQKNDCNNKAIDEFVNAHQGCIAKPVHGTLGRGLKKIHGEEDVKWLRNQIAEDDYILEECVTNNDDIRTLNPSSLNTIRAFTHITNSGETIIDEIILRVGWPGNVVDNWGAGGIIYYVDVDSGIIVKPGIDKHLKEYIYHPGSNIQMIGYKLNNFDELKAYIVSLAGRLPKARVVGWDIAITPQGYDFIELNCPGGHDILQAFNVPFWNVFKHIK